MLMAPDQPLDFHAALGTIESFGISEFLYTATLVRPPTGVTTTLAQRRITVARQPSDSGTTTRAAPFASSPPIVVSATAVIGAEQTTVRP